MPATPADIAAGMREARVAQWYDAGVKARYPTARDGAKQPAEGFFDDYDDAVTVLAARAALIGTERRRLPIEVADLLWLDPSTGSPTVTLIDGELAATGDRLVARIETDAEAERTTLEVFG